MHPSFSRHLSKGSFFDKPDTIYMKNALAFTGHFKKEFKWLATILEPHYGKLNEFISFKNRFEKLVILDDLNEAEAILTVIEDKFGISLWSIEANLLLAERKHGSEANWNMLTQYIDTIKIPIYEFIIGYSSKKVEESMSFESYFSQFQNDLNSINADAVIRDFFVFKNIDIATYEYEHPDLASVLYIANILSAIDQYLILIDVIIYNVTTNDIHDKLFSNFVQKALSRLPSDTRLRNILNITSRTSKFLIMEGNETAFSGLDKYYRGNFDEAITNAKAGILTDPLELEYYELYCKSLINLKIPFTPTNTSETIDSILKDMYTVLSFAHHQEDAMRRCNKTSLAFGSGSFGKRLFGLISELNNTNEKQKFRAILEATFNSPKNLYFYNTRPYIYENFTSMIETTSYNVVAFRISCKGNEVLSHSSSPYQKRIYTAQNLFSKKNYEQVINLLTASQTTTPISYYFEQEITLLFNSYIKLERRSEALQLFGTVFVDDEIVYRKLKYSELYGLIKSKRPDIHVNKMIEYPILWSLIVKEYDLYEAYDDFMSEVGLDNVRDIDIDDFVKMYSLKNAIHFFREVLTIDTLKYSTDYHSISHVEEDRIYILRHLLELDPENKLTYEREINEVYRLYSVRKVLKEVDEGRLYIDVNGLKNLQVRDSNDDFKRFKEIEFSASNQRLIGFNPSNTKNWDRVLTESLETNDEFNQADYLAFKSIYLQSRDNFLFSKEYGLEGCLSTRIRHGALKNHIRSVFEKLDLVTSKSKDVYNDNVIWGAQLAYYPELNSKVQEILRSFSREIDEYTVFIVEKLIQIQTEKTSGKEDALFKFFVNDNYLLSIYLQNKHLFTTMEATVDILFSILVSRSVLEIQDVAYTVFSDKIFKKYLSIIEERIAILREMGIPIDCQLIPNLVKSVTDIQRELDQIGEWFFLNTTNSSSLLDIQTVVEASLELTNKINPNSKIAPLIKSDDRKIMALSANIFIFNILFNNIIQHSHLTPDQFDIVINMEVVDGKYFRIAVSNNLNPEYDYSENKIKLSRIKDNWNDHRNIERSDKEGDSGFDKIKRILIYETLAKTDRFDFKVTSHRATVELFFPYKKIKEDENSNN